MNEASLYFHIPFCTKKCPYCHFYVIPNRISHQTLLSESLALEWSLRKETLKNRPIVSIYFGGGTPSLFRAIAPVLKKIPYRSECEITLEANPEEGTIHLFEEFLQMGINRLSLGVQSLDNRSLETLERIHSAEKAKEAIRNAQTAGFKNISIDLMYDLPGQTEESWQYTLDQLEELPIDHLSLYNLTIEPHTSFHKRKVKTAPGELSLRFLHSALKKFEEIGLKRYEISAFCRPGHESRHNLGYWTGRPFLGFGPSAFSYWEEERFQNIPNIHRYARSLKEGDSPIHFREKLSYPSDVKELLAIRLRLKEGVEKNLFHLPPETVEAIEKLKELGWIKEQNGKMFLTEQGMLFYDSAAVELI